MARSRRNGNPMAVRKRGWLWRLLVAAVVFLFALLGWGGWRGLHALVDSDMLTMRYIEIEGCRVLPEERVYEQLEAFIGQPLLSIPGDSLRAEIEQLPRVASARLKKRLPGTLRCRIVEARACALLYDGEFKEIDSSGQYLPRFGDQAPDLPIIRTGGSLATDSLITLSLNALTALRASGFDLSSEVSEIGAESEGIFYTRNESETRVILGWRDFDARCRVYAQAFADIGEQGFPGELDLRFRNQVVAR